MTDDPNTPDATLDNNAHPLESLTLRLEDTLTAPQRTQRDILSEQSQILNQLFATIMNDKVSVAFSGERYDGSTTREWLDFALRTQKQCIDTIKAKGAIDYMSALRPRPAIKNEKQTEGS